MLKRISKYRRMLQIIIGTVLIVIAYSTNSVWYYLGILPLLSGITNFCPLCIFLKRCSIR
ncbi:MAG: hypothetical protein COA66_13320 [Arcobacter sp.]|nr:MAG: hypothetical protein COA66_13320 [Arcobacter sp.]